jgi:hypothetical protein
MSRLFFVVLALLLALLGLGIVILGAFPPHPKRAPVEHVIPTDKLPAH